MKDGEMILSPDVLKFNDAKTFCKVNNGELWSPTGPLVTGDVFHEDEVTSKNGSNPNDRLNIFDLFSEESKMSKGSKITLASANDFKIAWTNIQRK